MKQLSDASRSEQSAWPNPRPVRNSEQLERARELLREHRQALENLAGKLLEQETVDGSAADEALAAEAATAGVELAAQPGSAGDAGRTVAGVQIPMEGQVIAEAPDLDAGGAPG